MSSSKEDSGVDVSVPRNGNYSTLHLYALDHLSGPAMATQCERVFSAARKTLMPERNAFGLKILDACEYLRW
jgi:hAT family C-terminal dimerisation region